jgi:hypothetical protein
VLVLALVLVLLAAAAAAAAVWRIKDLEGKRVDEYKSPAPAFPPHMVPVHKHGVGALVEWAHGAAVARKVPDGEAAVVHRANRPLVV